MAHLRDGKFQYCSTIIPASLKVRAWDVISSKFSLSYFFDAKRFFQRSIWTFCVNLSRYKIPYMIMGTSSGSWQDGAHPHRTAEVFFFRKEHFDDRVFGLDYYKTIGSNIDRPVYSPDLTPYDIFLCEGRAERRNELSNSANGYCSSAIRLPFQLQR